MTYNIDDYLQHIPLKQGDTVHLALNPTSTTLDENTVNAPRFSHYEISLDVFVNGKPKVSLPIASVLKTSRTQGYGTFEGKVSSLSKILCENGLSRGAIVTPFFEPSPLRLEHGMSTNSAVYVLSGLLEYAAHIAQKIDHTHHPQNITLGNKSISPETLDLLTSEIEGIFHGYHARTVDDYGLLIASQGHLPTPQ